MAGPDASGEFRYPLEVGYSWEYEREFWVSEVGPVASAVMQHVLAETSGVYIRVEGEVVLPDSTVSMAMLETITSGQDVYESAHFYAEAPEGLYLHAYVPGSSAVAPKPVPGVQLWFKGRRVTGPADVARLIAGELPLQECRPESMIYEVPPVLVLPSELDVGDQWTVREAGSPWRVDKRVVGVTRVEVPAGSFVCHVVEWLIDFQVDGEWDEDVEFHDYVSPHGLVRRSLHFDMVATSPEGDTLGFYETTDVSELVVFDLCPQHVGAS